MQDFLQSQLPEDRLKLQVLRTSEIRSFLLKCYNTVRGTKLTGICVLKRLGRNLGGQAGKKRADN